MTTAKKLAYGFGTLLLAGVVVGVFLPSGIRIERDLVIDAPPATVFALVNDLRRAPDWLPWIDADAEVDIDVPSSGSGALVRWDGVQSGRGKMTIVESVPFERVAATLGLAANDEAESTIVLSPSEAGTAVSWSYAKDFGVNLVARYTGLFLASRRGHELARGLRHLETLAESLPRADWSEIPLERLNVEPMEIAYLTATSLPNAGAISEAMGDAYFNILAYMGRHDLEEAGAPLSISRRFSGSNFVFDAAIPVRGVTPETPRSENGIELGTTYGGPVIRGRHVGSYGTLRDTHEKIAAYLAVHGIARAGDAWEAYVSDPARTPESELITDVYYPIGE